MLIQTGGGCISILARGGLIMVPLLAASILSLAVIIERLCGWRQVRTSAGGEPILALVVAGHLAQAMKVARASQHPVARVLLAGLEHQYPATSMAMESTAQAELQRCKRGLP